MKRILVISRNFPPLWGGMERLNLHLVEEISQRFDVCLIAPQGASKHLSSSVAVTEIPLRPLTRFLLIAAFQAALSALRWRPQIVIAGSGLTAPIAYFAAKLCGAKSYAYVHGLDIALQNIVYRTVWRPILRRLDGVIANSQYTAQIALEIGIRAQRISVVHPGVVIPEIVDRSGGVRFREKYGLGRGPILLSVGRLTARKGMREFVREVLPTILSSQPDAQLLIVGDEPTDSLYAEGQSIASIIDAAKSVGVEKKIHFLGKKFGDELAEAYFSADVHVFPVRTLPSDPEGFGMVAIEAAAHGLPTVAYATGGVVDAVSDGVSGLLVSSGDTQGFADAVIKLLINPLRREDGRDFANNFSWDNFGKQVCTAIK